jgi:glutathionylspermidine synthase
MSDSTTNPASDAGVEDDAYGPFAAQLIERGILQDPWYDGAPRFAMEPHVIDRALYEQLGRAAEEVAEVFDELCRIVDDEPALLEDFFCLEPTQRVLWQASAPRWHGIARADVFVTDEGLAVAELNCDTPTGEAEATELNALVARSPGAGDWIDPNAGLRARYLAMVDEVRRSIAGDESPKTLGIVYPTEFSEDLSVIRLYRRWFEGAGYKVVLGSPYNLGTGESGRATLFDQELSVLVRHYKSDWWTERASVWTDETLPDTAPLIEPLRHALTAEVEERTAIVNPFGAIVPQNKRAMAFFWEHIHRFSTFGQGVIERLVPYTSRLETVHEAQLRAEREKWVLKSDYGAEGDEVIIGRLVTDAQWDKALRFARPGRWIAQRFFDALAQPDGSIVNYGVYLVAGERAGLYLREQAGATNERALSLPVFVAR